jgi:hypothetical protein
MLRQGPVPVFVHGVVEYVAGILLIAAPFLFSFEEDTATAVAIVGGVLVLIVTASTDIPTGMTKSIPIPAHAIVDFILAGLMIASPFLFGFDDDGTATAFFIAFGVVHLLLTIGTRFVREERPRRRPRTAE